MDIGITNRAPFRDAVLEYVSLEADSVVDRCTNGYDLVCIISGCCNYIDRDGAHELGPNALRILLPGSRIVEYRVGNAGVFQQILIHVDRELLFGRVDIVGRDEERFESAIINGISLNLSVETMAQMCCYSVSTFKRRFRERYGVSPHRWLLGCRLDIAEKILTKAKMPTNVIATICGFINVSHFIATFRRRFGKTPSFVCRRRFSSIYNK